MRLIETMLAFNGMTVGAFAVATALGFGIFAGVRALVRRHKRLLAERDAALRFWYVIGDQGVYALKADAVIGPLDIERR